MKKILLFLSVMIVLACQKKMKEEPGIFYTCSMDPQIMERKPGNCPICKMELTRTLINDNNKNNTSIKLSETQIKLAQITVEEVKPLLIGEKINLRGTLISDGNKLIEISARVAGRIERLYFKSPGENIKAGDHIYDIYSEELESALKEYLALKDKRNKLKGTDINYEELIQAAKERILLLDISEKQLENLSLKNTSSPIPYYSKVNGTISDVKIKEGDYVNEGSEIFNLSDYKSLWIEVEVYPEDQKYIQENSLVNIKLTAFPEDIIKGKITFSKPELEKSSKINIVNVEIPNKDNKYKPGMPAAITIETNQKTSITVQKSSILSGTTEALVWIQNNKGDFEARIVTLGIQNDDRAEVTSGLSEGDKVVISGAYLLNSEYILRKGSNAIDDMDEKNEKIGHH